jgi:hypothetical protein
MASDLLTVFVDERTLLRLEPATLEERAIIVTCEEARFLALSAARSFEARAPGLGTRLCLGLRAKRERDPVELRRIETGQHVRLVLFRVESARE